MTTATANDVDLLKGILERFALKVTTPDKPFILASGEESLVYFDVKQALLAPEAFVPLGRMFFDLAEHYQATAAGGLAVGSIPISMAVVGDERNRPQAVVRGFYVRDAPKDHGTKETVYQSFDPASPDGIFSPNARLLIVDDVLTTGTSIGQAMDELLRRHADIAAIAVVVDRQRGGAQKLRAKYGVPVVALYQMGEDGSLTAHGGEVA